MISTALAGNRKGRFLQNLLGAEVISLDALPDQGLLMLTGEELNARSHREEGNADLIHWAENAGCVLMLIPPYDDKSRLLTGLDWHVLPSTEVPVANDDFTQLIAFDVRDKLIGADGDSRRENSHCWRGKSNSPHTRFYRKHANSGMLALTVLPLWSISLLDEANTVWLWLQWFVDHAGKPPVNHPPVEETIALIRQDLSLLVCAYGYASGDLEQIKLMSQPEGLFNFSELEAEQRWPVLRQLGLINDTGLSVQGFAELEESPLMIYAERLRRTQR